jgi:hypothetical protein
MNKISMARRISRPQLAHLLDSTHLSPSQRATLTLCGYKLLHLDSLLASRATLPPESSPSSLELIVVFRGDTLDTCILSIFANTGQII